jgi:hypothetical protein
MLLIGVNDQCRYRNSVRCFEDDVNGEDLAYLFLQLMKAVTKSMTHTNSAAQRAKHKIFSFITYLGMPAIMFTITSVDDISFRIGVYFNGEEGSSTL